MGGFGLTSWLNRKNSSRADKRLSSGDKGTEGSSDS